MATPQQLAQALMQSGGNAPQLNMVSPMGGSQVQNPVSAGSGLFGKVQSFFDNSNLAPRVNQNVTSLIPSYNENGLQYSNPDTQSYYKSLGRPLYLAGPTNNAMINDISHQLQTNGGGLGRMFNSAFSWQPTQDKQSIYQQWANQMNQNGTGQ